MKQTLNEGTGGQWEEEIGFSWGTPVGQQGGVFAGVLKAMQISTGEDRNAGHFRWAASPKARVRGLDFYPSVSFPRLSCQGTWSLFGSLVWVTHYLGEPAGWRSAQVGALLVLPFGKRPSPSSSKDTFHPVRPFISSLFIYATCSSPCYVPASEVQGCLKKTQTPPLKGSLSMFQSSLCYFLARCLISLDLSFLIWKMEIHLILLYLTIKRVHCWIIFKR